MKSTQPIVYGIGIEMTKSNSRSHKLKLIVYAMKISYFPLFNNDVMEPNVKRQGSRFWVHRQSVHLQLRWPTFIGSCATLASQLYQRYRQIWDVSVMSD